jgi:hypothetical protein
LNFDLAIEVGGNKLVVPEGQNRKEKGIVSEELIGDIDVGIQSDGLVLRDEDSGLDILMQGGDVFKRNVVLYNTMEGQDGLVPFTHEMPMEGRSESTRMDVELES